MPEVSTWHRMLRFAINGLLATAVHFGVLSFNIEVLQIDSAGVANLVAAMFGITASFVGNRYFVFRAAEAPVATQAAKFLLLYATLALLHGLMLYVWTDRLGFDYRIGFVLATGVQLMLSYLGNKAMVFVS